MAALFGAVLGSWLNVLIYRIPRKESTMTRSHCTVCNHKLSPVDLIPVLSYLFLRGKCRYCGSHIPLRYPLVELGTSFVFVFAVVFVKVISVGAK